MKKAKSLLKLVFQVGILVGILSFFTGCATSSLDSNVANNVDLKTIKTAYVEKLAADARGVEILIAEELNRMGIQAASGPMYPAGGEFDALVTYQDKWMWDITMYMLELRVQIKEPETKFVMASGHSYRTSLVRKSPEEMVAEVLGEIFK